LFPNPSDLGPGFRQASGAADVAGGGSRWQQVAAGGSKHAAVESKQGSLHVKVHDKVQKWREIRNARLSLLWYLVARGRQQENSHRQVGSARASPLAFSPVAGQPRNLSDLSKNGEKCEMRVFCCYGTRSRAASSRRNTLQQAGSARASPLAFNQVVCQPRRSSPPVAVSRSRHVYQQKLEYDLANKTWFARHVTVAVYIIFMYV